MVLRLEGTGLLSKDNGGESECSESERAEHPVLPVDKSTTDGRFGVSLVEFKYLMFR